MNWIRILITGVVAGIVGWIADYALHGYIMAGAYTRYPEVFTQEKASMIWLLLVSICITTATCILFAKTYSCWSAGVSVRCGFCLPVSYSSCFQAGTVFPRTIAEEGSTFNNG